MKHWGEHTFIVTQVDRGSLGVAIKGIRVGYCKTCFADMTNYENPHRLHHYASHKRAIAQGLWGRQKSHA